MSLSITTLLMFSRETEPIKEKYSVGSVSLYMYVYRRKELTHMIMRAEDSQGLLEIPETQWYGFNLSLKA